VLSLTSNLGVFGIKVAPLTAEIILLGDIIFTIALAFASVFYSLILGKAVKTASKLEDDLFGNDKNTTEWKLTRHINTIRIAGEQTWMVMLSIFIPILGIQIYLLSTKDVVTALIGGAIIVIIAGVVAFLIGLAKPETEREERLSSSPASGLSAKESGKRVDFHGARDIIMYSSQFYQ
jgi:hypothetical protein